jgi:hypothetical protein
MKEVCIRKMKRGWQTSSASRNEASSLELSGVGKCPGSSGASDLLEVCASGCHVLVGNKIQ